MFVELPKKITLTEFLQLPETKPIEEYIDGNIYEKPMPKGKHSTIQTFLYLCYLYYQIGNYVLKKYLII